MCPVAGMKSVMVPGWAGCRCRQCSCASGQLPVEVTIWSDAGPPPHRLLVTTAGFVFHDLDVDCLTSAHVHRREIYTKSSYDPCQIRSVQSAYSLPIPTSKT